MSRLTQVLQNTLIRVVAIFSVFFKYIANFFGNLFRFFGSFFGVSDSQYFLESDAAQGIKRNTIKEDVEPEPAKAPEARSANRRRPNPQMDYYRKMAQEVRKE
ncbi:MAG: threonine dehydratase [Scytonema sp. PMC 1070.18]|nr:threonine dehydratase [Scytonema sp. PMC 1070.18]